LKTHSERIPRKLVGAQAEIPLAGLRGWRANFKMAKIPYIWKIPCSLLQGSSISKDMILNTTVAWILSQP